MKVAVIGGGAAGFFAAIHVKENFPESHVTIYEKSSKLLAKVKVSGGGRCNVCNACTDIDELSKNYPRGEKQLRKLFGHFSSKDTMNWFESRGVQLVIQEDGCVFPKSQNSQTIIDCLAEACLNKKVDIKINKDFIGVEKQNNQIKILFASNDCETVDKVIVTIGGQPKLDKLKWLTLIDHKIENPVPSLFTFNMPNEKVNQLMGVVVEDAAVNIQNTNLKANGPLLITHWGMSGPAILKLSAFGARILSECNYQFKVQVNWLNQKDFEKVKSYLSNHLNNQKTKQITNCRLPQIPQRLWDYLLEKSQIDLQKKNAEIGQKQLNKLCTILCNDEYSVSGKTTFKEEFVTCGGVSFDDVDVKTLESKKLKGLFFAGEILDVDGITGGFNFQAAWTTAFIAARLGIK